MTPQEQKLASCLSYAKTAVDRWICENPGLADAVLFTGLPFALMLAVAMAVVSFMRRRHPFAPTLPTFFSDLAISSTLLMVVLLAFAFLRGLLDVQDVTAP